MSNQGFGQERGGKKRKASGDVSPTFSEASSRLASNTTNKAQQAARATVSSVSEQVKDLLDRQVENGADMVGHLAASTKMAAEDLTENAPQLASLVQGLAERLDGYADDLRDQSVDQLWRNASDYTRRQPAVIFGVAALVGFFALRTIKSTPPRYVSRQSQRSQTPAGGDFR